MKNYYFFVSKTEDHNGQLRKVLKTLPGFFFSSGHGMSPVDTNLNVQLPLRANQLKTQLPVGTIFVGFKEGNTPNRATISIYNRGAEQFYRMESVFPLFLTDDLYVDMAAYNDRPSEWRPSAETVAQWDIYIRKVVESYNRTSDEVNFEAFASMTNLHLGLQLRARNYNATTQSLPSQETPSETTEVDFSLFGMGNIDFMRALRTQRVEPDKQVKICHLIDMMSKGVVEFSYMKQNGELRHAKGTRCPDFLSANNISSTSSNFREQTGYHVPYFDLEKSAFRCFCTPDFQELKVDSFCLFKDGELKRVSVPIN